MAHPMQHYGERKNRNKIRATYYRHFAKATELHPSFDSAARSAASACEANTAAYEGAENLETGEKWDRSRLLARGYELMDSRRKQT